MVNKIALGLLITLTLLVDPMICLSQESQKHEIRLLARAMPDSVILRWAPTTYTLWQAGNINGYKVTRTLLYKNGQLVLGNAPQLLTKQPLKPVDLASWELLADRVEVAGVAAQAIYGDDLEVDANSNQSPLFMAFQKESLQKSKMGFALLAADQSVEVASYSGLYFADKSAVKGEKYIYKVYPAIVPQGLVVDTAYFFTGVDEYLPLVAPASLNVLGGDKMATLTWEKLGQQGLFSGFLIERSDDGGKTFTPRNTTPMLNTTPNGKDEVPFNYFIDSLSNNQTTYQYRLRGITPFGELSPYSNIATAKGRSTLLTAPRISRLYSTNNTTVCVEWELPYKTDPKELMVRVQRSDAYDGTFITMGDSLKASDLKFTDNAPLLTGYYRMQAFNSDGDGPAGSASMMQLVDSIPPLPPKGLTAVADTTGKVSLRWLQNSDNDIYGYRVFRANSDLEEFSQITSEPIKDTLFIDKISLRTLTKKVFYQVVAIDKRQNRSTFSEILTVSRPDIVPPTSPRFRSAESANKGALLSWYPSSSNDVINHLLYRQSDAQSWEILATLSATDSLYTDTTCVTQTLYKYKLVATDSTGNRSNTTPPVAVKYAKPIANTMWITPYVEVNKHKGTVELKWDAKQIKSDRILIYTKNSNGQWMLLKGAVNSGSEVILIQTNSPLTEFQIKAVK